MTDNNRLFYFDSFRAIAILLIVLGHCYTGWERNSYSEVFISNAITGGTALFVFISGFFLHYIFYKRKMDYLPFIKKKFISVGVPYFILSSLYMLLYFSLKGDVPTNEHLEGFSTSEVIFINFLTGRTLIAYWYIPLALILFSLTPLFYSFVRASFKFQIYLTLLLFALSSIFFWRPIDGLNPVHSVLYFAPFYLLGIIFSINHSMMINVIQKYKLLFLFVWLISLALMNYVEQIGNNNKSNPFSYEGVDLMVVQKISLIFLLVLLCYKYFNSKIKILSFIANNSFPVFFIHGWVLSGVWFLFDFKAANFAQVFAYFLIVISISLLLSVIAKKIFGIKSKFLIGS